MNFPIWNNNIIATLMFTLFIGVVWFGFGCWLFFEWLMNWRAHWNLVRARFRLAPIVALESDSKVKDQIATKTRGTLVVVHAAYFALCLMVTVLVYALYQHISLIYTLNRLEPTQVAEINIYDIDPDSIYRLPSPIRHIVSDPYLIREAFAALKTPVVFDIPPRSGEHLSEPRRVRIRMKDSNQPPICIWVYTKSRLYGQVAVLCPHREQRQYESMEGDVGHTGGHHFSSPEFIDWINRQVTSKAVGSTQPKR